MNNGSAVDGQESAAVEVPDLAPGVFWHVDLPAGVQQLTSRELEEAYEMGVVGPKTMVLRADAPRWALFEEVAGLAPPLSHALPSDSGSDPSPLSPEVPQYASVPPMATDIDVTPPPPPPYPTGTGIPGRALDADGLPLVPTARFDGAFGPGNFDSAAEVRKRRLIFAGVLTLAMGGGFFAATGTTSLKALAAYLGGGRATQTVSAAAPPPAEAPKPPPAASIVPAAGSPSGSSSADPSKVAAPPPTGIPNADGSKPGASDQDDADKTKKKKRKRRAHPKE